METYNYYEAVSKHILNYVSHPKKINISGILSALELGSSVSVRRTFSKDRMLKAYVLFKLKNIKSYEALVNYLRNRPDEALDLGFDKNPDGTVVIPTHQNISHFVRSLSADELALVDHAVKMITETTEKLGVVLDVERKKMPRTAQSAKTLYNHRKEKTAELIEFVKKRLKKKSGFKSRYNAIFKDSEFVDELVWLGFEHNFAESGCKILSTVTGKRMPNADTLLYHIKKIGFEGMQEIFSEFIELTLTNARQKGIITDRPVDLAIDVTPAWRFYGDRNADGVEGYKFERGTSFAYQFITVDVTEHNQRLTLMALPVFHRGDQNKLVEKLLSYTKEKVRINRVLLDRGFFDAECIKMINRLGLRYIMPAKINSRDVRNVSRLTAPRIVPNCAMRGCRFNLVVTEINGEKHYFATNIPTRSDDLIFAFRIRDLYRRRWQIESGYRTKKYTFLPKTCSKNYAIRYFYFMMSVVLYNYWVMVDIAVLLYLGLNTKNTQITAKMFSVQLLAMEKKPGG